MGAQAHQPALVQHENQVRVHDARHPLGDDEHRASPQVRPQFPAQAGFGGVVQRGEAIVEDVDGRALDQGPRDGQALPLAAGEIAPALGHLGLQTFGVLQDEIRLGHPQGLPQGGFVRVGRGHAQVAFHRALEQGRALGHIADALPQFREGPRSHVQARDQQAPRGDVVKAGDEVHQGGLPRARGADDAHHLARLHPEGDGPQHVGLRVGVTEGDLAEFHPRHEGPGHARGPSRFGDGDGLFQHIGHPVGGNVGPGVEHEDHGHHHEGEDHHHGVLHEGHHIPHADVHLGHLMRAHPENAHNRGVHHQGHEGHDHHEDPVDEQGKAGQGPVLHVKAGGLMVLPVEGPHHHHAREVLPHHPVHPVHLFLNLAKPGDDQREDHRDEQDHQEHGQGQGPPHVGGLGQGQPQRAEAHEGREEGHAHQDVQGGLNLGDVVGRAGDEGSGGKALQFRGGKGHHVADQGLPQVVGQAGREAGGEVPRGHGRGRGEQRDQEHFPAHPQDVPGLEPGHIHAQGLVLGPHHPGRGLAQRGFPAQGLEAPVQRVQHGLLRALGKPGEHVPQAHAGGKLAQALGQAGEHLPGHLGVGFHALQRGHQH